MTFFLGSNSSPEQIVVRSIVEDRIEKKRKE